MKAGTANIETKKRYFFIENSFKSKINDQKKQFVWRKTYCKTAKNIGRKNDPIKNVVYLKF